MLTLAISLFCEILRKVWLLMSDILFFSPWILLEVAGFSFEGLNPVLVLSMIGSRFYCFRVVTDLRSKAPCCRSFWVVGGS